MGAVRLTGRDVAAGHVDDLNHRRARIGGHDVLHGCPCAQFLPHGAYVQARRRMRGHDPVEVPVQLQIHRVEQLIAGLDLRDEVPAHLVEVGFDHVARALQYLRHPGLERLAPGLRGRGDVRHVMLLPAFRHHGIGLEQQEKAQAGTAGAERLAVAPDAQRQGHLGRRQAGIEMEPHLAIHGRMDALQQAQCVRTVVLEFGRARDRQQPGREAGQRLQVVGPEGGVPVERRQARQPLVGEQPQPIVELGVGQGLEDQRDVARVRLRQPVGARVQVRGQFTQARLGPFH